ncbi:hypothetical protein [Escherichia coli]|uniref:hypothetical protein n=1 Tax=Escherichia coli TaxID=562 RepID=UPI0020322D6D|nr:hypothetical protein [Escherichia coli]
MDAKKTGGLILFLLLLLVGVLIASNYLGGYTALRYSSVDMSLLKWDTFHSVISTFSGNPQYKKLVFMAWFWIQRSINILCHIHVNCRDWDYA